MTSQPLTQALAAFSDDLANIVSRTGAHVVALQARRSYPASALLLASGVAVTAAHALRREDGISAVLPDGSTTSATLLGVDPSTDVAVLRMDSGSAADEAPPFADAATVRAGEFVVAVARGTDNSLAASGGLVARSAGAWRTWRGGQMERRIQLDGGLFGSFAGAPVVDSRGNIIGIGTPALSRGRAVVIPGETLQRIVEQILARGRVSQAYIGAAVQPVEIPQTLQARIGSSSAHGLIVMSTVQGGPADAAGISLGDVLLTLGGRALADIDDLKSALAQIGAGNVGELSLIRGGQSQTVNVSIGERPQSRA